MAAIESAPPYSLPTLHVQGSPTQMGESHGEARAQDIRDYTDHRLAVLSKYLSDRGYTDNPDNIILDLSNRSLNAVKEWDNDVWAEHDGIARAAGIDPVRLHAATEYSDVRDLVLIGEEALDGYAGGCTSFIVPPDSSAESTLIAGQTWDLHPGDMQYVTAIHRTPEQGPETWSVTTAGSLSLMGMNQHGLYVGTTNIKVRGVRAGIPYLCLLHKALQQPNRSAAASVVKAAERAAAHTYWFADAQGGVELECSAWYCDEREVNSSPWHQTNHCLAPQHQREEAEAPSASSTHRYARAGEILEAKKHSADTLVNELMADRADGEHSISRFPEDGSYAATNACVIAIPERREFRACRGPAQHGTWETLAFTRS